MKDNFYFFGEFLVHQLTFKKFSNLPQVTEVPQLSWKKLQFNMTKPTCALNLSCSSIWGPPFLYEGSENSSTQSFPSFMAHIIFTLYILFSPYIFFFILFLIIFILLRWWDWKILTWVLSSVETVLHLWFALFPLSVPFPAHKPLSFTQYLRFRFAVSLFLSAYMKVFPLQDYLVSTNCWFTWDTKVQVLLES